MLAFVSVATALGGSSRRLGLVIGAITGAAANFRRPGFCNFHRTTFLRKVALQNLTFWPSSLFHAAIRRFLGAGAGAGAASSHRKCSRIAASLVGSSELLVVQLGPGDNMHNVFVSIFLLANVAAHFSLTECFKFYRFS